MAEREEIERLIRMSRVRAKALVKEYKEGKYENIINEAYNVMFMAAKAALSHLGAEAPSHRAVSSLYRKELANKHIIGRNYAEHLRKIHNYREEAAAGKYDNLDPELAGRIVEAMQDFVDMLGQLMKKYPEPIIDYDISDFA